MSRFVSPFERVTDSDNKPIVGAKLFFYETGTKTLKTIYLDFENTIPAENPVLSLEGGINPDRYINGIYNIVQTDNTGAVGVEGALIWERDPIGDLETGPFSDWNSTSFYSLNDIVKGSDLSYYVSVVAGINTNQGNDPVSSPTEWDVADFALLDATQTLNNKTLNAPVLANYSGGVVISDTAVSPTGVAVQDFTAIPSWAKRVTVVMAGISFVSGQVLGLQIGDSGGIDTTADYVYQYSFLTNAVAVAVNGSTTGAMFRLSTGVDASDAFYGRVILDNLSSNTWVATWSLGNANTSRITSGAGSKTLAGGALTQVRLTSLLAANFDAGTVNVFYEG